MRKTVSTVFGIIYLLCSISAIIIGLFSIFDYCPLLETPMLIINFVLLGLVCFLNRDNKLRLNLFSIEMIIGYLGIMLLFVSEQTYYSVTIDSFVQTYYKAVGNVENWLFYVTAVTIAVNIFTLFDKKNKLKKVFDIYYIIVLVLSVFASIYLMMYSF